MGIGYTLDAPLKLAPIGIDSVISLVDDILIERFSEMYCLRSGRPYEEITDLHEDYRAARITAYLDLIDDLIDSEIEKLRGNPEELKRIFYYLPDESKQRKEFFDIISGKSGLSLNEFVKSNLRKGSVDVNIMTKLDKQNSRNGSMLPFEYNDAHSALRGFAKSKLESSIVLSAGMNASLYSYISNFEDFYPDENGKIKKKITLKVSDYRSALIQGKFLAKKGLWVSEFRIESGLNCGGHAFATDGHLIGPILEEFRDGREKLTDTLFGILSKALKLEGKKLPPAAPPVRVTAQGGVGTPDEHSFLLDQYNLDSIGWGTPFLLVPEITNVDEETLSKLLKAGEDELYLSGISPLGIPFNNLRGNTKDREKEAAIKKGEPGSSCPKRFLVSDTEFTNKALCKASKKYQRLKIEQLKSLDLDENEFNKRYEKIVEKSCICVGLGTSALIIHGLNTSVEGDGVSICPGPNMAYYSKKSSLAEMIDFIYGRIRGLESSCRPSLFLKELMIYIEYLRKSFAESPASSLEMRKAKLKKFRANILSGIEYYHNLFKEFGKDLGGSEPLINGLVDCEKRLEEVCPNF